MLANTRLVKLRKEKKLLQAEVAKKLNIERTTYVRYEKGEIQPPSNMIVAIAKLFNTTSDYLLDLTDDPTPPTAKNEEAEPMEHLEQFLATSGLSEKSKRDLLDQLELLKMRDKLKKLNEEAEEEKLKPRLN